MSSETGKFTTIGGASEALFKDRGSKFLAYAYPISETKQAKLLIDALRKEHPKAVHFCFAYRIGTNGLQFRAADDGEPAGSAGKPILGQIDSAGLTDVLVVVVRYFGGTLLGVPGLINAYKTATADALSLAVRIDKWISTKTEITTDYQTIGEVLYILRQHDSEIIHQDMQLFCTVQCLIPQHLYAACERQLLQLRGLSMKKIES